MATINNNFCMPLSLRALLVIPLLSGFLFSFSARAFEPGGLALSLENEPVTLDWNRVRTGSDRFIVSFLMRGLLKYDAAAQLVCDLCKSYSISADQKVLTFKIDTDVIWSDKVPLEAQHFVDSFRRVLDPALRSPAAADFAAILGAPQKPAVRAEGKDVLEITLARPQAIFAHYLTTVASFPIRKDLLKNKPDESGENHASTAVLGAYKLGAWERGRRIVIEGNNTLKTGRPVYRVDFILGTHARFIERFTKGRLQILANPTTEDLMKVKKRNVQVNPYWATRNLMINTRKKPLDDVGFRRALLYGLDRAALPGFLRTGETAATGLIPKGLPGYRELPLTTVDPVRAKQERARFAQPEITLRLLLRDNETNRKVASWLAEQLKKLQIVLAPRAVSPAEFDRALRAGDFDLALQTFAFGIASPLETLQNFRTGAPGNFGKWAHVAFDALVDRIGQNPTPAELTAWVEQACQTLEVEGVGVIPLGYPTQSFLLEWRVQNFATTPFGDPDLVKIALQPKQLKLRVPGE